MSRYLVDTDVLISFSKGRDPGFSFIRRAIANGDELGVTAINVAEFYSGLGPENEPSWDELFELLEYWPVSRQAARQAGRWRNAHARRGHTLTTTDCLLAAVANERAAVIVTNNVKDYTMAEVKVQPPGK
jgi:predicted nucleic acid-binding protein